jgi:hypothetical protein
VYFQWQRSCLLPTDCFGHHYYPRCLECLAGRRLIVDDETEVTPIVCRLPAALLKSNELITQVDEGHGTPLDGPFLDFRDPWGNRVEIVGYDNIQFTKAPNVLRGMGLIHLAKNEKAKKELAEKVMLLE